MATQKTLFNEINITPLTDIFLVLLIIMMVVAPMLDYPGLKLAVPSIGPDVDTKTEPKTLTVAINAHDGFSIDNQEVSPTQLSLKIRELKKNFPDGMLIEADPKASHNALTQAMDAAQQAGVTSLAVTEAGGGSGQSESATY